MVATASKLPSPLQVIIVAKPVSMFIAVGLFTLALLGSSNADVELSTAWETPPPVTATFSSYEDMQRYFDHRNQRRLRHIENPLQDSYLEAYNQHNEEEEISRTKRSTAGELKQVKQQPALQKFEISDAVEPTDEVKELIRRYKSRELQQSEKYLETVPPVNTKPSETISKPKVKRTSPTNEVLGKQIFGERLTRTKRSTAYQQPANFKVRYIPFEITDAREPDAHTKNIIKRMRALEIERLSKEIPESNISSVEKLNPTDITTTTTKKPFTKRSKFTKSWKPRRTKRAAKAPEMIKFEISDAKNPDPSLKTFMKTKQTREAKDLKMGKTVANEATLSADAATSTDQNTDDTKRYFVFKEAPKVKKSIAAMPHDVQNIISHLIKGGGGGGGGSGGGKAYLKYIPAQQMDYNNLKAAYPIAKEGGYAGGGYGKYGHAVPVKFVYHPVGVGAVGGHAVGYASGEQGGYGDGGKGGGGEGDGGQAAVAIPVKYVEVAGGEVGYGGAGGHSGSYDAAGGHSGNYVAAGGHGGNYVADGGHGGNYAAAGGHGGNYVAAGGHGGNYVADGGHGGNYVAAGGHGGNYVANGGHGGNYVAAGGHGGNYVAAGGHGGNYVADGGNYVAAGGHGGNYVAAAGHSGGYGLIHGAAIGAHAGYAGYEGEHGGGAEGQAGGGEGNAGYNAAHAKAAIIHPIVVAEGGGGQGKGGGYGGGLAEIASVKNAGNEVIKAIPAPQFKGETKYSVVPTVEQYAKTPTQDFQLKLYSPESLIAKAQLEAKDKAKAIVEEGQKAVAAAYKLAAEKGGAGFGGGRGYGGYGGNKGEEIGYGSGKAGSGQSGGGYGGYEGNKGAEIGYGGGKAGSGQDGGGYGGYGGNKGAEIGYGGGKAGSGYEGGQGGAGPVIKIEYHAPAESFKGNYKDIPEFQQLSSLVGKSPEDQIHGLTYLLAKEMQNRLHLQRQQNYGGGGGEGGELGKGAGKGAGVAVYGGAGEGLEARPQDNKAPVLFHPEEPAALGGGAAAEGGKGYYQPIVGKYIGMAKSKQYIPVIEAAAEELKGAGGLAANAAGKGGNFGGHAYGLSANYKGLGGYAGDVAVKPAGGGGDDEVFNANSYAEAAAKLKSYASKYAFGYRIRDFSTGNDFGHKQNRDLHGVTRGQYHILLPDGRIQNVIYHADDTGFHADVSFESGR